MYNKCGMISKEVSFLYSNALVHKSQITMNNKVIDLGFKFIEYPTYSSDLTLSNYHFLSKLQKSLKDRKFSFNVIEAVES